MNEEEQGGEEGEGEKVEGVRKGEEVKGEWEEEKLRMSLYSMSYFQVFSFDWNIHYFIHKNSA